MEHRTIQTWQRSQKKYRRSHFSENQYSTAKRGIRSYTWVRVIYSSDSPTVVDQL
ncbi:hypothetical protein J3459_018169, partial [Metarhizium acridum]